MISDEPDEDADALDDDTLLENYAGIDPPASQSRSDAVPQVRDWPPSYQTRDVGSCVDAETLAWFMANKTHWRAELNLVLRGWIAGQVLRSPAFPPGE